MALRSRNDLLSQRLPRTTELCPQNGDGEGAAGIHPRAGDAVQGACRSARGAPGEQKRGAAGQKRKAYCYCY